MKVFITGATGYIGFHVAQAYRRAGHEVWGLARSPEKATRLARHEIRPVLGSMERPDTYTGIARECSVLIHTSAAWGPNHADLDRKTLDVLLDLARSGPRPKKLVYTSGTWVQGDTGCKVVDETTPLQPLKAVAWRPAQEERVLSATDVEGLVIRPGYVYGMEGGLTAPWFSAAEKQRVISIIGEGSNHWTLVHTDDLGEAYLLAGESSLRGEVFLIADAKHSTVRGLVTAVARVCGGAEIRCIPVEEAARAMGDVAAALASDQHVDAGKATRLLGWHPRHAGFIEDIETYYQTWKASCT